MPDQEHDRLNVPARTRAAYNNVGILPEQFQQVEGLRLCLGRDVTRSDGRGISFKVPTVSVMAQAFTRAGGISGLRKCVMETAEMLDVDPKANPSDTLLSVAYRQISPPGMAISKTRRWAEELSLITNENPPL